MNSLIKHETMQPINKKVRPDGIIELTVIEEVKYLFFFSRKKKITYLGHPEIYMKSEEGKKPKSYNWYKGTKKVSANTGSILTVLSDFYNID